MKIWALEAGLLAFAACGVAYAQEVKSFDEVAGSWRGKGRATGTDSTIVIGTDGRWTTSSKAGSESGKGAIKNGAFLIEWKGGYGKMEITKANADAIVAKTHWYSGSRWIEGYVDATRCAKPDCTDKGAKDY